MDSLDVQPPDKNGVARNIRALRFLVYLQEGTLSLFPTNMEVGSRNIVQGPSVFFAGFRDISSGAACPSLRRETPPSVATLNENKKANLHLEGPLTAKHGPADAKNSSRSPRNKHGTWKWAPPRHNPQLKARSSLHASAAGVIPHVSSSVSETRPSPPSIDTVPAADRLQRAASCVGNMVRSMR